MSTILFDGDLELYQGESAFYPQHAIIVSVALGIFISILYIIHKLNLRGDSELEKLNCFLDVEVTSLVENKFKKEGKLSERQRQVNSHVC